MDAISDWLQILDAPVSNFQAQWLNYVCHSSGRTRADLCSAFGWIIDIVEFTIGYKIALHYSQNEYGSYNI